jgi:hypothetical protein
MGYYNSLIRRKFTDVAGTRYDGILKEYADFLPSNEEFAIKPVSSVFIPLDYFSPVVSGQIPDIIAVYDAPVEIVYIIDEETIRLVSDGLGTDAEEIFRNKEEALAGEHIRRARDLFADAGVDATSGVRTGVKGETTIALARNHDLMAIGKKFGMLTGAQFPASPAVLRIQQVTTCPVIMY